MHFYQVAFTVSNLQWSFTAETRPPTS